MELFLKALQMMYLCQFGLNLAIGSEEEQRRLFHSHMSLVTLKLRSRVP